MTAKSKTTVSSTQQYINIAQIRNGIIVTKTGLLRAVIKVEPVNFALKSDEDQSVIIGQYQNFLNALNFPIQVLIQSRRLDVAPYLMQLEEKVTEVTNELLRFHAAEYIDFVRGLTEMTNIMDKRFYVAVGFDPPALSKNSLLGNIFGRKEQTKITFTEKEWAHNTEELGQRLQLVMSGLNALGLKTQALDTQGAIEVFYNIYNPEEGTAEKLTDVSNLQASVISGDSNVPTNAPSTQPPVLNPLAGTPATPTSATPAVPTTTTNPAAPSQAVQAPSSAPTQPQPVSGSSVPTPPVNQEKQS